MNMTDRFVDLLMFPKGITLHKKYNISVKKS